MCQSLWQRANGYVALNWDIVSRASLERVYSMVAIYVSKVGQNASVLFEGESMPPTEKSGQDVQL